MPDAAAVLPRLRPCSRQSPKNSVILLVWETIALP